MTTTSHQLTTPPGRLVQGNLYELKNTDAQGRPLTIKNGVNAGQVREDCFMAVAIPKTVADFKQEPWAAPLLAAAQEGFPAGQFNQPTFAYKVVDGDSQIVDQGGKRPCDKIGFAGHWVIRLNSGYLPKILNADGTVELTEKGMIKLGDYIQVHADIKPNGNTQKPGVYINHKAIAFLGYGERIAYEADYSGVGFGQAPMPAGASSVPPAGSFAESPAVAPTAVAGVPTEIAPVAPTPDAVILHGATPLAPTAVAPNPAILTPPAAVAPIAPVAPVAPAAKTLTAKAGDATYEQMTSQGWTDQMLIQHGYMEA